MCEVSCGAIRIKATGMLASVYNGEELLATINFDNSKIRSRYEVTEICPNCEEEVSFRWSVAEDGFKAFCPRCGARLMLCDECQHRLCDSNGHEKYAGDCDYCSGTDSCMFNPAKINE